MASIPGIAFKRLQQGLEEEPEANAGKAFKSQ